MKKESTIISPRQPYIELGVEQLQKLNEISAKKLKENENTLVLNRQLAKDNFENNKQNEFWFSDEKKINNNDVRQIGFDISRAIEIFGCNAFQQYSQWAWNLQNANLDWIKSHKMSRE